MKRIAFLIALTMTTLFLSACGLFAKPSPIPTPTDAFKNSLYREFSAPLTEGDIESFNKFYCLNRPDWIADSVTCLLVDEAASEMDPI